jgi:hypothetical protein
MIGHRLLNEQISSGDNALLEVKDVPSVPPGFLTSIQNAARPLGFVVVDVGLTSEGKWCLVECNPPFALSSYDLPMDIYVSYCSAAWEYLVSARNA